MLNKLLYQNYHSKIKPHKRVIFDKDFTYRNIIESINPYLVRGDKVLDIGSATGTLSFYLASKGLNVDGIELSKNAHVFSNINKKNLQISNVNFINTSIENYTTNKKYDVITCFEVLEHLEKDLLILKKINTMMRSSALLIISVPSKNAPLYKLGFLSKFDKEVGHLRRYSLSEIKKGIRKTGFKIVKCFKYEGILRNILFTNKLFGQIITLTKLSLINYLITKVDNYSLRLFGESQILIVCKKR